MTSMVGRTINTRYRLEALLGDGGMGAVYRAYDLNLDRQVAIKLMHAHFARRPKFRARLIQEAKTSAQLDHPSVVSVFDFGDSDVGLFIAMEHVDGGSLRDHLRRLQGMQKYLPLTQSLQIAAQIADALDYAHRRGIIHRDVKPGNIILKRLSRPDEPGEQPFRAVLTDFGLVKLQEGSDMTEAGVTVGTPTYMSPEQCTGEELDGRSDIYSLGVVLYELVTNQLPFTMQTLSEAIAIHSRGSMPPAAHEGRSDVPPLIDTVISRALAKDPAERYREASEMVAALHSATIALDGAPTQIMAGTESNILERMSEPPPGHELEIETPGHETSVVPLIRSVVTMGRHADNDIVLPAEGVSRHHARLQATALGWELIDLGGINGTWLDDHRLRPDAPTPVRPESHIHVGPYRLTLKGPEGSLFAPADELSFTAVGDAGPSAMGLTTPQLDSPSQPAVEAASVEPLGIFLPRDKMSADPGQRVELSVEVVNRSDIGDRVSLRVHGLPGSWISSPEEFVPVPAGQTVKMSVGIRPPRHRTTPAGRQRLHLELISQQHPNAKVSQTASLMLGSFVAFDADLPSEQIRLPGIANVSVTNVGNAAADFSLVARDRQGAISFRGEKGRVRLDAGQTANVELEMSARRQGWFGGGEIYPFEVEVVSSAGGRQVLSREARSGSALPVGVIYGLIFVVTFACVIAGLALLVGRDRLTSSNGSGSDATAAEATGSAIAVTQTIAFATEIAGAVADEGDIDGDGLSDEQEAILGTNPEVADSDSDGLTDGEEMLTYGSDPRKRDTDGDILLDGDEVLVYRTDPTKMDTDGDGVDDGIEIAQGTDPLAAPSPTATSSASPLPTEIVTPSVTPSVTPTAEPSLTATVTNTPEPSATVTATATPTNSPTATETTTPTETSTPTETATMEPTPTPTASPTSTPISNPALLCLASPPVIDGDFQPAEWGSGPLIEFQPTGNPARLVQVYFSRDIANWYMAMLINDDTVNASDSLRFYIDATNNGGDPDSADRFFQIGRDGSMDVWSGVGGNGDNMNWDAQYDSSDWSAAIGEPGSDLWVIEMTIDSSAELIGLTNPFAVMVQVLYTGDLAAWPGSGVTSDPNSWQDVVDVSCP